MGTKKQPLCPQGHQRLLKTNLLGIPKEIQQYSERQVVSNCFSKLYLTLLKFVYYKNIVYIFGCQMIIIGDNSHSHE